MEYYDDHGERPDQITWARIAGVEVEDVAKIIAETFGASRTHVENIRRHFVAREVMRIGAEVRQAAAGGENPYELLEQLDYFASTVGSGQTIDPEAMTIFEMADLAPATAPWIIPGCLKKDWRAIVTGEEGAGKGVLLRCMAACVAEGVHPFTHHMQEPHRTLLVDLENPMEAILETGITVTTALMECVMSKGREYSDGGFKVWYEPGGIDIRNRNDKARLVREIAAQKPELVCIGPYYKLTRPRHGESWEEAAMAALGILDDLRTKYGFALVIEAHSAKASNGAKRALNPIGSVYLTAWPELGIGLRKDDEHDTTLHVEHFRGARLKQQWPDRIERDRKWVIRGVWDFGGGIDF